MAEVNVEVLRADVEHIKNDVLDLKCTVKEQGVAVLNLRDSHLETKFYIKSIQESQSKMATDTKKYQEDTMAALQLLKDARGTMWEKLSMAWKVTIVTVSTSLLVSYIWGTVFGIMKNWGK